MKPKDVKGRRPKRQTPKTKQTEQTRQTVTALAALALDDAFRLALCVSPTASIYYVYRQDYGLLHFN
jgi:hypothetical protein